MMDEVGRVHTTPGAEAALEAAGQTADEFLLRHANGDWGELGTATSGDQELREGLRIFSAYILSTRAKICIFTEDDRSLTVVHLQDEADLVGLPRIGGEPMNGWTRTWRRWS